MMGPLWVTAFRPSDHAFLLSDGRFEFITFRMEVQGRTPVLGPFPAGSQDDAWCKFQVQVPFHGPLRGLTREELDQRAEARKHGA